MVPFDAVSFRGDGLRGICSAPAGDPPGASVAPRKVAMVIDSRTSRAALSNCAELLLTAEGTNDTPAALQPSVKEHQCGMVPMTGPPGCWMRWMLASSTPANAGQLVNSRSSVRYLGHRIPPKQHRQQYERWGIGYHNAQQEHLHGAASRINSTRLNQLNFTKILTVESPVYSPKPVCTEFSAPRPQISRRYAAGRIWKTLAFGSGRSP